ncbi:helix-turn-helix domain-containing protein [Anaerorhabdus furcosa]|uniref:Transcriptional regulator, contains XRE-family HTH domain n=1 Tax=Anaerorhabdus furcosa TaxID=118967 RepID=A0A1T4K323_9FIRM|nr:helix-turn-helix transcriptional regulator [Anaerorhabdus furcosa]SJZ36852.1 Transcriptional regulator, contains XRE-family HTH domain [Anaerorhabdus furcosa]
MKSEKQIEKEVKDSSIQIGERIKLARLHYGYTKTQLADQLGISYKRIIEYENGQFKPRETTLRKIANVLSVNYFWLTSGALIFEPAWFSTKTSDKDTKNKLRAGALGIINQMSSKMPDHIVFQISDIILSEIRKQMDEKNESQNNVQLNKPKISKKLK